MNEKFYQLPQEKQMRIINAGYKVFSRNSYEKAPMLQIAEAADISKSLLFYYFRNKRELYSYLWTCCIKTTERAMEERHVMETDDFFEMLRRSLEAKCSVMERYPYLWAFSMRAYYEQDLRVKEVIRPDFSRRAGESLEKLRRRLPGNCLKSGLQPETVYQEILWATDGYTHNMYLSGKIDPGQIREDFERLIQLWETAYGRKTGKEENRD